MVTGRRAFVEVERSQLISAILHRAPVPAARLSPRTSPEFDRIIEKCLEKDPENRYQSSKEVAVDLRRLFQPQTARVKELRKRPAPTGPLTAVGVLVVVASIGVFWARQHYQPEILPRGGRIMLAVLPFENRSGDPAQDYFGEGLTEEMISQLGRLSPKQLGVIARTSVMRYQHADKAIAQIGQELRVDYILDGGTRQVGDRVHVTAELIHAQDQTLLWSSSYERRVEDIFGLQNAVAISVAKALTVELLPAEQEALNKVRPINPQAHESYLRGRFHWSRLTGEELEKAREYFDETVKIDPTYSQAYVGLADYYRAKYSLPPKVAMTKAREYAQRALALDKTLPEAHLALAAIEYSDWNWLDAQQEFEWAVKLNPSYAEAHQAYSIFLSALGHINEAWKEIRTAQELDPLSVPINTTAGWIAYFARRNDLAIEQCKKALDLEPNAANAHDCLGSAYLEKRMYREAIHECQTATTLSGQDPDRAVCLGRAHVAAGERRETVKVLQTMQAAARQGHTPPYFLGVLYAALKEDDQAFASLEESYRERDPYLVWIKVSPAVDPLRSDARFEDLLRRLAFPD